MKKLLSILLMNTLLCFNAIAYNQVIEIHEPGEFGENFTIFIDNGEIIEVDKNDKESIDRIKMAHNHSLNIELKLDRTNSDRPVVKSVELVGKQTVEVENAPEVGTNKEFYSRSRRSGLEMQTIDPIGNYNLTTLPSYEAAQDVMDKFDGNTREKSQCYNRAHVWTYQTFINSKVNLGKVWIFFSRKYIREYKYKWWFHIAPFTKIEEYETPYILDRGFTMVPYTLENWKNIYIKNKAKCMVVNKYSEYKKYTNEQTCFFMFSSQYYWQPKELKRLEFKKSSFKWGYSAGEVRHAYNDSIIDWNRVVPTNSDRNSHDSYRFETSTEGLAMPTKDAECRGRWGRRHNCRD
jgi:hypothetical protein